MMTATIDLTGNSTQTPQQQLNDAIDNASPAQAAEIKEMLSGNKSFSELIKDYGEPNDNEMTSADFDRIYRDIFATKQVNTPTDKFNRLSELYTALTDDSGEPSKFVMETMYEIIYGSAMNDSEYEVYANHGTSNYFSSPDTTAITNDVFSGSDDADFNELKVPVNVLKHYVKDSDYYDSDYRRDTGTHGEAAVNPYIGQDAVNMGLNAISQILRVPINTGQLPTEIAMFFSDLNIDSKHKVYLPSNKFKKFSRSKKFSLRLSNLSLHVLHHIIMKADLTYGKMSYNSIMAILDELGINTHHLCIYILMKKTLLEAYSLCCIGKDLTLTQYLTDDMMDDLRKNLKYIKDWCSHYAEYRDLCEAWEYLDEAVGYIEPYFSSIIHSHDIDLTDGTIDYP